MKKLIAVVLILAFALMMVGCYTQTHIVGKGAQGNTKIEKKQWYVLWGLVPINDINSQEMAGGAADYTIMTQESFVDVVIGLFTGSVTVYPRSVTVTK